MIPWLMTACFYPCIIGPEFWGLVSKHWRMCALGKMQSPINIDPSTLLYDPALMPVDIDKHDVSFFLFVNFLLFLIFNISISVHSFHESKIFIYLYLFFRIPQIVLFVQSFQ